MTLGNTDGLRRGEHLSDRMEADERDETFDLFRNYNGARLDALKQELDDELGSHPGGYQGQADPKAVNLVANRVRQVKFAITDNDTLARLLADVYDAAQITPVDGAHARKIQGDIRRRFQKFKESME